MDVVTKRVNRIVGQLKGIERMIVDEREVIEILQQLSAVKKAINGLTLNVLSQALSDSSNQGQDTDSATKFNAPKLSAAQLEKLLKQAIDL
jgi:CsoR family transcriptional regulator, copper-sensing transcriptional repressor